MTTALQLPEHLTVGDARQVLGQLASWAQGGKALEVNASAVQHFDSAALAVLLGAMRAAKAQGASLAVHGASPKLKELAQLYGVADLLGL